MSRTSSRGRRARGGKHGREPRSRIRDRQQQVVARNDQGWTQQAIAASLEISQAAVSKILSRADARAAAAFAGDRERRRAQQLRRLEHLRREALQAWETSKGGRTRRRQRQTEHGGGGGTTTAEVFRDEQAGDPRLLDEIRKIEERISALYGFDRTLPPTVTAIAATACTPEELARRLNALDALGARAPGMDARAVDGDEARS